MAQKKKKTNSTKPSTSAAAARVSAPRMSPLLRSSLEVLEHGLWHFFRSNTATDMKFAILHVDQAIELLLKECVRHKGESIFKNPKETISIWRAYEILDSKKCAIPEKPDLELLHEERNNIQHKYLNPSPEDASFHISKGVEFYRRFLHDELCVDIYDHIPSNFLDDLLI
jgi:hypothetical protein